MNGRILIVDDSLFSRALVKHFLDGIGNFEIFEATNGNEAVEAYSLLGPDLVIMDIVMPDKNGIEALKEIKNLNPKAKVIIASSIGHNYLVLDAVKAGAIDFIVKPFTKNRLTQTVTRAMKI